MRDAFPIAIDVQDDDVSLIVTAVGSFCREVGSKGSSVSSESGLNERFRMMSAAPFAIPSASVPTEASMSGSGWMTDPPPVGFWTFLMRIGIFLRIACSIVNGWTTSLP